MRQCSGGTELALRKGKPTLRRLVAASQATRDHTTSTGSGLADHIYTLHTSLCYLPAYYSYTVCQSAKCRVGVRKPVFFLVSPSPSVLYRMYQAKALFFLRTVVGSCRSTEKIIMDWYPHLLSKLIQSARSVVCEL